MKTLLIGDLESFGIWEDDYDKFFNARAKLLSDEINKRVIKQKVDTSQQSNLVDDFEADPAAAE